ncbi:MAG: Plug domain-containing protein [Sodaliphilus pleomorphus]|uniref:Plug domain-containing protein n=1 Tax=Sodaliphilus pleomorphus TaxID=2606626 RepID=UPI002409B0C6|nr:Plug domain-containing protein [Sodaliphilus pleomorphus]MDD6474885.1 Plug domain-containing protein [Sodaliphilus pleomorphus]
MIMIEKNVWAHLPHTFSVSKCRRQVLLYSILLQEVVVTANKPQVPEDIFETWSPRTFDYEEIERKGISSLEDVLRRMPGIIVKNGQAYLMRGGLQAVGFFIDGTYFQPMGRRPERDPLLGAMPHDRPRRALELQLLHQRQQRHRLHAHHRGHHPGRRAHQQAHHHRQALTTTSYP